MGDRVDRAEHTVALPAIAGGNEQPHHTPEVTEVGAVDEVAGVEEEYRALAAHRFAQLRGYTSRGHGGHFGEGFKVMGHQGLQLFGIPFGLYVTQAIVDV